MQTIKFYLAGVFGLLLFSCQQSDVAPANNSAEIPSPSEQIGEVVWSYDIPSDFDNRVQPAIDGDWVYVASDTSLTKVSLKDGQKEWNIDLGTGRSLASSKILQDESTLYLNHSEWVRAYDKANGQMRWESPLDPLLSVSIPMKQQDGYLYLGRRGEVVRMAKSNGQVDLRIPLEQLLPEGVELQTAFDIELVDGKLYVGTVIFPAADEPPTKNGRLLVFELGSGQFQWGYEVPHFTQTDSTGATRSEDAGVYEIGINGKYLAAMTSKEVMVVDRNNGEEIWRVPFPNYKFLKTMAIGPRGNVIVGARSPYPSPMICLNIQDGSILWETALEASMLMPPAVEQSWIFLSSGSLQMINPSNGQVIWKGYPPEYRSDPYAIFLSPVASNQELLVCVGSKKVIALRR
ncbi:MAG: PQQ-binding-like beta-propeller repeat protein [Bacteroidota bacterium]